MSCVLCAVACALVRPSARRARLVLVLGSSWVRGGGGRARRVVAESGLDACAAPDTRCPTSDEGGLVSMRTYGRVMRGLGVRTHLGLEGGSLWLILATSKYSVDVGGTGGSLVVGHWSPIIRSYVDEQGCMCRLRQNNERRERGTTPMPVKGAQDTRPHASITLVMDCMRPVAERHYAQTQQYQRCIHGPVHGPRSCE